MLMILFQQSFPTNMRDFECFFVSGLKEAPAVIDMYVFMEKKNRL